MINRIQKRSSFHLLNTREAEHMPVIKAATDAAVADGVPTRSLRLPAHEFGSKVDPLQWRLCSEFPRSHQAAMPESCRQISPL